MSSSDLSTNQWNNLTCWDYEYLRTGIELDHGAIILRPLTSSPIGCPSPFSLQVVNPTSQPLTVFIEYDGEWHEGEGKESKQGISPSVSQSRIHCWPSQGQEWAEDEPQQVVRA